MRRATVALAMLLPHLLGCVSLPLPPVLDAAEAKRLVEASPPRLRAVITGCSPESPRCNVEIGTVVRVLGATGFFAQVDVTDRPPDDADVLVVVHPFERRSYYTTPAHNPAFILLSIAVPLWWSDRLGYRLSIERRSTRQSLEVDTTRDGTVIMWGLASLFNLASRRGGASASRAREEDCLKLQLLPLVERADAP